MSRQYSRLKDYIRLQSKKGGITQEVKDRVKDFGRLRPQSEIKEEREEQKERHKARRAAKRGRRQKKMNLLPAVVARLCDCGRGALQRREAHCD